MYIHKDNLSEADSRALKTVEDILRDSIVGFVRFENFRKKALGNVKLRFQYDWSADDPDNHVYFEGVGYLFINELRDGYGETAS